MPRVSKIKSPASRPGAIAKVENDGDYACSKCGRIYLRQRNNFAFSHSPLYKANGGYVHICNSCLEELYYHYREVLGSEQEAIRRVCMKLDIYWSPKVFAMTENVSAKNPRIRSYVAKTNLNVYHAMSFDDTLDEEATAAAEAAATEEAERQAAIQAILDEREREDENAPNPESVAFWGKGFEPDVYLDLDARYQKWTADLESPLDIGAEVLYKSICIQENQILRLATSGRPTEQAMTTLNNLIGSVNAKPSQKKQEGASSAEFDGLPFGVGIKMCENTRPIPKPIPELEDVDGIIRYVTVWFNKDHVHRKVFAKSPIELLGTPKAVSATA